MYIKTVEDYATNHIKTVQDYAKEYIYENRMCTQEQYKNISAGYSIQNYLKEHAHKQTLVVDARLKPFLNNVKS